MTFQCFECQKEIQAYPCACGYRPKALAPVSNPSNWLVRSCAAPGCGVMVREPISSHDPTPVCKWHQAGTAYNGKQIIGHPSVGQPISKEVFGVDLFEAIRVQSALRQSQKNEEMYQRKGLKRQVKDTQKIQKALAHELDTILSRNTIAPDDLTRLLEIT